MLFQDDQFILDIPCEDHIEGLDHLLNHPAVATWLGGTRIHDDIKKDIVASQEHWSKFGFGQWVVLDCKTSEIVARGGLRQVEILGRTEVELFYAVLPSHQRQGIATALAAAAMDHALHVPGLASIIAFTIEANVASLRVLEKLGFVFETKFEHADLPHILFRYNLNLALTMPKVEP
jgi:RimJ/RimL family protein N-acetyltransferase